MQTLERAIDVLAAANSIETLGGVSRELGFIDPALPLEKNAQAALGFRETILLASVARGPGSLRALLIDIDGELRETLTALADSLARRSPQLLWIVLAVTRSSPQVAIMCWSTQGCRTRAVSLVCNRERLFESDAETLCALSAAVSDSDLLTHSRWLDILGREAITRRFFRALQNTVDHIADSACGRPDRMERRELALLYVSRLLFLSFLETKGWLNGDFGFLSNGYSRCISAGGSYQKRILEPLFFGTLNTRIGSRAARARSFGRIPFLNGGLFARSSLEKRARNTWFSDEAFGAAYGSLLSRYRFGAREHSTTWSEASVDPEMLGKAFEALMASGERRNSGAFYTPQDLVEQVTAEALTSALGADVELKSVLQLRILDPACGSGAFLVHMLERIAGMRAKLGESGSIAEIRRRVLASSIFGVDLNPTAVWLCELRLWLSVVVENREIDPMRVVPLPNLDRHIRVGDSLAGGAFGSEIPSISGKRLLTLRSRYMRAVGSRKRTLARSLDRHERTAAIEVLSRQRARLAADRKELLFGLRARDLFGERHAPDNSALGLLRDLRARMRATSNRERSLRSGAALPFSFAAHFADAAAAGGFDLVVGNPPWVRLHRIPQYARERLRSEFAVYRGAAWQTGATAAGAGRGFAAQIDMSALFVERSHGLLRKGGTMALLLPSKLWRSLAGGGVRRLLSEQTDLVALEDFADGDTQFDAAVYPSLLVCRTRQSQAEAIGSDGVAAATIQCGVRSGDRVVRWGSRPRALVLDDTPGSPWLIVPPAARAAFDTIRRAGTPLAESAFGRPLLGVKTGRNDAYVVRVDRIDGDVAAISSPGRSGSIERQLLRALVRGETLRAWGVTGSSEHLVWPHDEKGKPLRSLPVLAHRWLLPSRTELSRRTDLHGRNPWWAVFRVESASTQHPRVIWADFGLQPRAMVAESGNAVVPLNTCYVVRCAELADAYALATLLNGPLLAAWLNVIAEPARGGYRRYLGWTMALLPVPRDWKRAREILAPAGARATRGDIPSDSALFDASLAAYRLTHAAVQPLLSWASGCI